MLAVDALYAVYDTSDRPEGVRDRGLPLLVVVVVDMIDMGVLGAVESIDTRGTTPDGARVLGGTSWTWRFRGWLDFDGGGRTKMKVCRWLAETRKILARQCVTSLANLSLSLSFFVGNAAAGAGLDSGCFWLACSSSRRREFAWRCAPSSSEGGSTGLKAGLESELLMWRAAGRKEDMEENMVHEEGRVIVVMLIGNSWIIAESRPRFVAA